MWEYLISRIIGLGIIIIIFILLFSCADQEDKKDWNNGYCSCGGHWEYICPIGHQATTTYMYKCDKCGKMKEFHVFRQETPEE